jgi:hypothetical protein
MAMKFGVRRLRTVSALKLALGDIVETSEISSSDLALRDTTPADRTCPVDRAGQIFLIIHDTHPTHSVRSRCAERHAGTFQSSFSPPRRRFLYSSDVSTPR